MKRFIVTIEVDNCIDRNHALLAASELLKMEHDGMLRQNATVDEVCRNCYKLTTECGCVPDENLVELLCSHAGKWREKC